MIGFCDLQYLLDFTAGSNAGLYLISDLLVHRTSLYAFFCFSQIDADKNADFRRKWISR